MLKASDVMRRRVETLAPDMTLREAAQLLLDRGISGAPVVDASRRVVGVLSQRDFMAAEAEQLRGRAPAFYRDGERIALASPAGSAAQRRVREVMTQDVISVTQEVGIVQVARLMSDRRIHRVVVLRGARLAGLVSSLDILRALADAFERGGRGPVRGRRAASRHAASRRAARARA